MNVYACDRRSIQGAAFEDARRGTAFARPPTSCARRCSTSSRRASTGARVLDGYAGTGAIGIEALSRGAAHVTFVEKDRRAAALIEENLKACGVEGGYTIQCADVVAALDASPAAGAFDLILLDPPYDIEHVSAVLDAAARASPPAA